ncbi:MAG TPA: phenylalanine--tRNA ligase subunit alpha, partial [Longimicrobium sp.]|nr:phenylalanine--tRNA ligase subunit alpha [Longimicrobium sp.]
TMSQDLLGQLRELEAEGTRAVAAAGGAEALEALRVEYVGRKGRLTGILRGLGGLAAEERPAVGAEANRVKEALNALLEEREAGFAGAADEGPRIDLSLPGRRRWEGGVHPVTLVIDEICDIFRDLGFSRVEGREVETVDYNFSKLNTPLDHPAADMHDTFYLADGVVLRTHTSPAQAHVMEQFQPPVRVVVPGMVYRRDPFDASHAPGFAQLEGLAVDEGITFADFKATIGEFVRRFFGADAKTRFRPSFFPFTEPSAEVDVSCRICKGAGCSACKQTGWMEIMGSGMVHPNVFEAVGYDPEKYTGYAFGMGPGRIAMQRYGLPDIRLLYESDMRFLKQFV